MGRSGGVSGSPFLIEHNRLRGGGPSGTGTGIITDGGDDYIWIQDNTLDRTGQVGIGIAGGNNNIVRRNKVYSPAITFTATNQGTNVGIYAWVNSLGATNGCNNITIQGNRVYWKYGNAAIGDKAIGADNPYWDGGNCGTINWANGNVWMDTTIGPSIFDEPIPAP
jgi:parallel beta-helix repeat protein